MGTATNTSENTKSWWYGQYTETINGKEIVMFDDDDGESADGTEILNDDYAMFDDDDDWDDDEDDDYDYWDDDDDWDDEDDWDDDDDED